MRIYCPTCRATDADECATPTGRDHPARTRLIYAQAEHESSGEKCGAGWKALAYHSDWQHLCTLTPGHFGKHLCRCGRQPSRAAPVSEPTEDPS